MPMSGDMRLRQIVLALVALAGIWIGLLIQRSHAPARPSFAVGPQPPDFPAPAPTPRPKLVHVPGLKRPAATAPLVKVTSRPHVAKPAPARRAHRVRRRAPRRPPPALAAGTTEVVHPDARSYAEAPTPPLEQLAISDAQVVALTSSSARITWRTNFPTQTQTAFGLDGPTIWAQPNGQALIEHESVLTGLDFSTTYHVYLRAVDEWNRAQTETLTLTTGPMPSSSAARTNGDQMIVDDRPFFASAVWEQCSDMFASNIDDGINLFMGDGCDDDTALPARLGGRAYSIVDAANADANGRGLIGWYFRDEWDAFLESDVTRAELADSIPAPRADRISFLTLTNHFYSRADPLPQGKGMYPVLLSIPDVVGFDLYPLQVWCRPAFGDVFESQRELHSASGGKPTFQWIEVARMEQPCRKHPELDPTPATVRAETWLAIGGGADAIGYFPNHWARPIGEEVARSNHEIKALAPALLSPLAAARADTDAIRVSARTLNGAVYVIAVNTTETTLQAKISVDGIAGRSVTVFGGGSVVGSDDQGFSDNFGPLAARVYLIPPAGW
jgi:hypothetical protein